MSNELKHKEIFVHLDEKADRGYGYSIWVRCNNVATHYCKVIQIGVFHYYVNGNKFEWPQ